MATLTLSHFQTICQNCNKQNGMCSNISIVLSVSMIFHNRMFKKFLQVFKGHMDSPFFISSILFRRQKCSLRYKKKLGSMFFINEGLYDIHYAKLLKKVYSKTKSLDVL
jgi:hypothetical protein